LGNDSDGVSVPVLKKIDSQTYIITKQIQGVQIPEVGLRRKFNFDTPSGRGFSRERQLRPLLGSAAPVEGTWHVAVIRIGFLSDSDDRLSSISTGGEFQLQPDSTVIIDPPPHNKTYFNAHMEGLKNYYNFQSCGKVDITWEIFPAEEDLSYKLSDIADYGPGEYGGWTLEMLVNFLHDAVIEADGDVNFGLFDAIVLVHAGAGLQSDVYNDTPNDIPSFFASLGSDDQIMVDGGTRAVIECSVVPETEVQDGYNGGIAAVLAHEFGHQLGLPDLYNTITGGSSIGVWDNMDSGGQMSAYIENEEGEWDVITGAIPGGLCAWSRYFLGWAHVDTVETFNDLISLRAVENCPAEIIRVDISNDEYFLIENRCGEINGLPSGFVIDTLSSVIIGVADDLGPGGWELTNGYDILLPTDSEYISTDAGPGLLIWHIDERLIAERWNENIVNTGDIFGVRLMEANGFFDLGDPSSWYGIGWYDDAYYEGNNTLFSDPFAWSNLNVPSGVRVENVSGRDTLMTFGAGVPELRASSAIASDTILPYACMVSLGEPFGAVVIDILGRGWLAGEAASVFSLESAPVTPIAFADSFSNGEDAVIIADQSGKVHAFSTQSWNEFAGWPVELNGISAHPIVIEREEGMFSAVADTSGSIRIYNNSGEVSYSAELPDGQRNVANIAASCDQNNYANELIYLGGNINAGSDATLWWWNFELDSADSLPLYLSDGIMRGDAALLTGNILPDTEEIEVYITLMSTGHIMLCSKRGIMFQRQIDGSIKSIPALADINGDAFLDIIYTDGDAIYAVGPSGGNLTGWPRQISDMHITTLKEKIISPISVAAVSNETYVIAVTGNGLLYTLDHTGEFAGGQYPMRIAASIVQPIELTAGDDSEGLIAYVDILENAEGNYYSKRPEETAIEWRAGPFTTDDIHSSWSALFGNCRRTSFAQLPESWAHPAEAWENMADNLIIYPNPSSGRRVGFHFFAPSGAEARLQVFNIAGEIVLERIKGCTGGDEHEFSVSMSDKAAGIYIGRVVITADGKSSEIAKKFAIVN
jgi:M6 family metalloprotease-like protein